jgi:hypothetical protein
MTQTREVIIEQEEDRISSAMIIGTVVVAALIGIGSVYISGLLLEREEARLHGPLYRAPANPPRAPREIGGVEQTLIESAHHGLRVRDAQQKKLESWSWVDRRSGIVRVPIDRAIDLWLERQEEHR